MIISYLSLVLFGIALILFLGGGGWLYFLAALSFQIVGVINAAFFDRKFRA